jgi:hypothetical protein
VCVCVCVCVCVWQHLAQQVERSTCKQWHWCVGNHELYNFTAAEWVRNERTSWEEEHAHSKTEYSRLTTPI